eukprot:CAMPEP_0170125246 /NCGR_PEP_ID=MMETSP0020_2-20130122/18837_1 /TAXON_ID=98059 /ORGANISM="Dinobryon sp., Strain UTEXLB2267" /LENGTH=32 /DNA_ID= /DNA_START= /DNA_END= /DNA_ORIENTATION=
MTAPVQPTALRKSVWNHNQPSALATKSAHGVA